MPPDDISRDATMRLQVLLPTRVLVDTRVTKVIAEAENGEFCLLPRHIDFVAALLPGILYFHVGASERYAAIDAGILVKCGRDVFVSTPNGVEGTDLATLEALVEEHFLELDEHERKARTALGRLEAGALRGFRELQERAHE
ncbi:MAG: F0F1 ATP synthase subunit epsilon [Gammaproteobacteria bacterium]|jgi:F-type H+-transporting ATPase subunit epsilon